MRITHQMLSRNYLNRMNTNLKTLTQSNERMASERAFNKAYENVPDAGKALRIRKLVADNERYQTTVRDAQGRAAAAEDALRTVNSLVIRAEELTVAGLNGTLTEDERNKIATELEKAQGEILSIMNTRFSENYVFSASGNADGSPPFAVENGVLQYQGTDVNSIMEHPDDKRPVQRELDPVTGEPIYHDIPWDDDNYVNIGFGYRMTGDRNDPDAKVDPNTAFKDTFSGVGSFGYGLNEDGIPINVYELFGDMVKNLRNNNMDRLGMDLDAIPDSMNFLLTTITEIGARGVTLENQKATLENEYVNLLETQNELEGIDLSEEIIKNKQYEMSWMVTLQLGSKILPQTIFDFIR